MAKVSIALMLLLILLFFNISASQRLSQYNVEPLSVTVSGISSGAAMATQFHFAHSSQVHGAGIVAGVPNYCGISGLVAANLCMSSPSLVNVPFLITQVNTLALTNQIDATGNITGIEFLFSTLPWIQQFSQPTHDYGAPCSESSANNGFLNNCDYRGAFQILNFLYSGITQPVDNAGIIGNLLTFDQAEFFALDPSISSMSREDFVYVPTPCRNGARCRLHISFHGCMQSSGNIGTTYAARAGFIEVAEVNDIIVLFPQIAATPVNLVACWDWFGYLNTLFATRQGNRILATHRMMTLIING